MVQPVARILGAEVHRIEEGSDLTVLCVIDQVRADLDLDLDLLQLLERHGNYLILHRGL